MSTTLYIQEDNCNYQVRTFTGLGMTAARRRFAFIKRPPPEKKEREREMVLSELNLRLNDVGYKNWIKAGFCLQQLTKGLRCYLNGEMETFHQTLRRSLRARQPETACKRNCRPLGNSFSNTCHVCEGWKSEILMHHTHRNNIINWGNCRPWLWPTQHWEVAKAYMPRGQTDKLGPDDCDAAALLNLINFCDHFHFVNPLKVREIIRCRNELMHSSEMQVSPAWMKEYGQKLQDLLQDFMHVPDVVHAGRTIEEVLDCDWTISTSEKDQIDGLDSGSELISSEQISEVEVALVKERLQEMCLQLEEQNILSQEDITSLQAFREFLKKNEDLEGFLQADLQRLQDVEHKLQRQGDDLKDTSKKREKQEDDKGISEKMMKLNEKA
nr:PREDICTED: uncharacterized protein CXorf38 homolog [Latimeria chalumnae]|eukprot:XP_005995314.1 PREDICTED: uncharacterized protein CXorf38 homolog [Latimeria chalumnae]